MSGRFQGLNQYSGMKIECLAQGHSTAPLLWGGLAQWIASRSTDQGVPFSRPGRVAVRCGLEQVTFTHFLILVKPRNPCDIWYLNMIVFIILSVHLIKAEVLSLKVIAL